MKSLLSIWRLLHSVKSTVKISSIFVAFLENMNFKGNSKVATSWHMKVQNEQWTRSPWQFEIEKFWSIYNFRILTFISD